MGDLTILNNSTPGRHIIEKEMAVSDKVLAWMAVEGVVPRKGFWFGGLVDDRLLMLEPVIGGARFELAKKLPGKPDRRISVSDSRIKEFANLTLGSKNIDWLAVQMFLLKRLGAAGIPVFGSPWPAWCKAGALYFAYDSDFEALELSWFDEL